MHSLIRAARGAGCIAAEFGILYEEYRSPCSRRPCRISNGGSLPENRRQGLAVLARHIRSKVLRLRTFRRW